MSNPVEEPKPLRTLVTPENVANLLIGRSTRLLTDPNRKTQVQAMIDGVATEVADIVGDPPPAAVAALAAWAVTLGAASAIEDSLFPEQQTGDDGRAGRYSTKYLAVLAQLRANPATSGTSTTVAPARGTFPPAQPYPDPALPWAEQPWGPYGGWVGRP